MNPLMTRVKIIKMKRIVTNMEQTDVCFVQGILEMRFFVLKYFDVCTPRSRTFCKRRI